MGKKTRSTKKAVAGNSSSAEISRGAGGGAQRKGFSPPQLALLVFLSVWMGYVYEYKLAVRQGHESSFCARHFFQSEEGGDLPCTEAELFFVRCKSYSSSLTTAIAAGLALFCWQDEGKLKRLNQVLVLGPLQGTLCALTQAPETLTHGARVRLFVICIVLTVNMVFCNRGGTMPGARLRYFRPTSARHLCLAAMSILGAWDLVRRMVGGPSAFTTLDDIAPSSKTLFYLVLADLASVVFLTVFALGFLDRNLQSVVLVFLAASNAFQCFSFLPKLQDKMRDDFEIAHNYLLGSMVACLIAAFFPERRVKSA